ncbi:MAG: sigma-54 dependent transcriptional regulator [Tepidisphaeraceae bacterium]|jgi:NtrC-family two-component system response regulator AlgB
MAETPQNLKLKVLVVDDEPNIRKMLSASLSADGHSVTTASDGRDAVTQATRQPFDLAFVDLRLGTEQGLELIPKLLAECTWLRIVVITAFATVETAVEAMRLGASDYLPKPFTPAQVRLVVERVCHTRALEQKVAGLEGALGDVEGGATLESDDAAMKGAIELARQVAPSEATVLIRGESGTGKGVLARAIHAWSQRREGPFFTISCPALSPQLLESELFGHVKGAFTGAVRDNPGRIAMSQGGTLFLDEIGDMPMSLQPKLLRFVQERQYERVGDTVTRRADVRVVSATNVDLQEAVRAGRFREDLLYRINVIQIDLPPLRQRPQDLENMARGMLAFFSRGRPGMQFTPEAIAAMRKYDWPGNVRELRNAIERATILARGDRIGLEHLPANLGEKSAEPKLGDPVSFDVIEAEHIRRLVQASPTIEEAARVLGIDAATLWRKRKKFGI